MPTTDSSQSNSNPFEIVTAKKPNKIGSKGVIIAVLVTIFLGLGTFVGVLLVRQNQNIAEKAAKSCVQQCAAGTANLVSCDGADLDGAVSICNQKGRIETCGGKQYCCTAPNGAWSIDMTACAVATVAPTATATATSTATSRSTATSTSRATATAAATRPPVPVTGTEWPTYFGIGLGVLTIFGSLFLAL